MNHLQRIIEAFPSMKWHFTTLSCNPNIDVRFVSKHMNKNWDWESLSRNATMEDVLKYPHMPWDIDALSSGVNITMKDVISNPRIKWNYRELNRNKNITMRDIREHPLIFIHYRELSSNPNITIDFIVENMYTYGYMGEVYDSFDWYYVSTFANVTIQDVLSHPECKWNYQQLYQNKNITLEGIELLYKKLQKENIYRDNWEHTISLNPNITIDFVLKHKDKRWRWDDILSSRLDERDILAHLELPWNWSYVSQNPTLSIKTIIDNPELPWNWYNLSLNPCINMKFILDNMDKPWDWRLISRNPSITADDVINNKNIPWVFGSLYFNKFNYSQCLFQRAIYKLKIVRGHVKFFKHKNWYKVYRMTKTEAFWKWYCAPGGIGNSIDKKRLQKCVGL